jgi:hypothetical protein
MSSVPREDVVKLYASTVPSRLRFKHEPILFNVLAQCWPVSGVIANKGKRCLGGLRYMFE